MRVPRGNGLAGSAAAGLLLCALVAAPAGAAQREVRVDLFDNSTPRLEEGQIEILTLSTMPGTVTGGDVLVAVRGLEEGERLRVERNGREVTDALGPLQRGERQGLVRGLKVGRNRITATTGKGGRATLEVENHPVTGPVFSGPQQQPFYCQTEESGLGPAKNRDCSIKTQVSWYYRSRVDMAYRKLQDPYAAYPPDVMTVRTSRGTVTPFVVRVETATINRGIARMAVLDDPHERGPDGPFPADQWNREMTYAFGESCGVGYRQGVSSLGQVLGGSPTGISGDSLFATLYGLADRLGEGDLVATSTMTTFGVYCNPLVSAETMMMIKEHVTEEYGGIARTIGIGGSGGAVQQYNVTNNYPGLVDGATPIASFADIPTTAMTVLDCGLLLRYWEHSKGWSSAQKAAVAGHVTSRMCESWIDGFFHVLDPRKGCDGKIPDEVRFDPKTNPDGVRCTVQDATAPYWGTNKKGYAHRPIDNTGVQYGLRALGRGQIDWDQFLDMNERVGGYNLNAHWTSKRTEMPQSVARQSYRIGIVTGRGAWAKTPIIDLATYLDLIPAADIHDVVRPFMIRARLAQRGSTRTQSIWRGISLPPDARLPIERWVDGVERKDGPGISREQAVAAAQPGSASDRCIAAAGAQLNLPEDLTLPLGLAVQLVPGAFPTGSFPIQVGLPETQRVSPGICQTVFQARSGTRIEAGGPRSNDNIKCRLKPVDPADYVDHPSAGQLSRLRKIFPEGVCDWSKPAVGDVKRSMIWPSLGGEQLERPHPLRWTAARSR